MHFRLAYEHENFSLFVTRELIRPQSLVSFQVSFSVWGHAALLRVSGRSVHFAAIHSSTCWLHLERSA